MTLGPFDPQNLERYWHLVVAWMEQTIPHPWAERILALIPTGAIAALWVRFVINPLRRK